MPFHIVHLGLCFFFRSNTIFICFPSVKPWAHHFSQAGWGVTGKGIYRADTGERTMGGGNSSFTSWRRWARPPSGKRAPWPLRGPSPWRRRATVWEKGSWHNSDEAPEHSPTSSPGASNPCCGSSSSRNLSAVSESLEMALVRKLWLGISEMVRGPGATKLLWLSSVSVSGPSPPLWTVITQQGGGSPDQGGGGDEFGTGVHFQGMKAKGPRAAPHADKTEGQGGGSPWTSFKFSLGAFCQRIFNVLCIT